MKYFPYDNEAQCSTVTVSGVWLCLFSGARVFSAETTFVCCNINLKAVLTKTSFPGRKNQNVNEINYL